MDIHNFLQVSDTIASSGQPSAEEFAQIKEAGYKTVINLAMTSSSNAIENEADLVAGLGMNYVHIPIPWEKPTREQFELFSAVMTQQKDNKVWVHCALNMRVSAFMYLYNVRVLGVPEDEARGMLNVFWEPEGVWAEFIR